MLARASAAPIQPSQGPQDWQSPMKREQYGLPPNGSCLQLLASAAPTGDSEGPRDEVYNATLLV
eukprot:5268030-Pyramimonas_sp.AAC.1